LTNGGESTGAPRLAPGLPRPAGRRVRPSADRRSSGRSPGLCTRTALGAPTRSRHSGPGRTHEPGLHTEGMPRTHASRSRAARSARRPPLCGRERSRGGPQPSGRARCPWAGGAGTRPWARRPGAWPARRARAVPGPVLTGLRCRCHDLAIRRWSGVRSGCRRRDTWAFSGGVPGSESPVAALAAGE
jgi:hypothetical protein